MASSLNIKCRYQTEYTWATLSSIYYCSAQNPFSITSQETAKVTSNSGIHNGQNDNDDVLGFFIIDKTANYFPQGVEKLFKNLRGIAIFNSHLKHVSQSDLRVHKNLILLDLAHNDIEVLEQGVFDYNSNLEHINLAFNKIKHIHLDVFKYLRELFYLKLSFNPCIDGKAEYNSAEVQKLIEQVKNQCSNASFIGIAT